MSQQPSLNRRLEFAVVNGRHEEVEQLIELGADVNSRCHDELNTPLLTVAVLRKFERIVHLLASAPGVDVNEEDDDGFTALYYAVRINVINIAKILLERGAALKTRPDQSLGSLLTWARIMKNVEMADESWLRGFMPGGDACKHARFF